MTATDLPPAEIIPLSPPRWTDRFGEDDFGIFAEFDLNSVCFAWRWCPPGRFRMGSPDNEIGRRDDEGPAHEVTFTRGFWMGETPVTQAQWEALAGENPARCKDVQHPVHSVSWRDCIAFARTLSDRIPGLNPSLPGEAEWEYACRAGTTSAFNNGDDCTQPEGKDPALEVMGWYAKNSKGGSSKVKQKLPNAWGLYDMHGNVWEWCLDEWARYSPGPVIDPKPVADEGEQASRVVRSGAWVNDARVCRAAYRNHGQPGNRNTYQGFRLAAGQVW